ncbi:MAG: Uma2 family endonuclease [Nostoc sp. DedQUE08]|uniref:Uma2 family endonuclease n=1 Tax=unclassified Nostoc TaxID=2593658 RepID=UPI002AD3A4AC|nr:MULTISPECIES: Uma2 family endonuclease [unclassified Nostoc]MDZ8068122.1 Uma2 family endonuclease [Nostoc sp. DedQUE08]MDZ8095067.1 Uma2 family endonuclease [Nostoc sp. DedQUE05]
MSLTTAKRFTIAEYHRLAELGFFEENDLVELIKGEIIQIAAKGTSHSVCETRLEQELYKLVGDRATLRGQQPITLSNNSEPEPDRVIAKNRDDDYLANHPSPSDILFLIEIADSSLKYDQEEKLPIYAEAGISDYWIFNLVDNYLECYSEPYQALQSKFGYRRKFIYLPNESVNLPCFSDLVVDLSKVFPG